jgi:hypothetical protein
MDPSKRTVFTVQLLYMYYRTVQSVRHSTIQPNIIISKPIQFRWLTYANTVAMIYILLDAFHVSCTFAQEQQGNFRMSQSKCAPVILFILFQCIVLVITNDAFTLGNVAIQPLSSNDGNRSHPIEHGGIMDKNSKGGIFWENLSCLTQEGDAILKSFSGFVANGQVCGILGPCRS